MVSVRVDGAEITYRVTGDGEPVLLVAGTGYPGGTWHPDFVRELARDFAVVTFDQRGTGASTPGSTPYSTPLLASDALAVLASVGEHGHVVGHSMGGRVAQWMAVRSPRAITSMVLASSGPGAQQPVDPTQAGIPITTVLGLVELGYSAHIAEAQRRTFFTPGYASKRPDMVEWLHQAYWAGHPELCDYLMHVRARQAHTIHAHAGRINSPTLVVVGSLDTHAGATGSHYEQSAELHRLIPGSEFVALEGLSHGLFWEGIDASIALLRNWFGRHHPGRHIF